MTETGAPEVVVSRQGLWFLILMVHTAAASATTYQVGPGRPYTTLQQVAPMLGPGDVVEVDGGHTYPGDVVFTEAGTEAQPITVRGVGSQRPVLSGGTNTVTFESPWPYTAGADWYVLEGFEVTGGSSRCVFHQAANLVIRDTVVHDCPQQGILGADEGSGSLTLDRVEVYASGSGTTRHQVYMATDEVNRPGSVFRMRHCYVHDGLGGNNVKSRAERNEIYFNWVEGAVYHELELIGPDPGMPAAPPREDSDVVGNVLRKVNSTFYVVRFGGDATGETAGRYRFVNNTVLASESAVFRMFDAVESIEMHNNVFVRADGAGVNIIRTADVTWATGAEVIAGSNNWVETGSSYVPTQWTGTLVGADPGFADLTGGDLRPTDGSPLVDAGNDAPQPPPGFPFPSPLFPPGFEPPLHTRPTLPALRVIGGPVDIGAFEHGSLFADGFESSDTSAWAATVP